MKISREALLVEAEATGFRAEILEKVILLIHLLEGFRSHPFLKDRLALKGGTALNLFVFDLPRLSVDIDLNYVGSHDREVMLAERPKLEEAIRMVCTRERFEIIRMPGEHAGGKWLLRYGSALGPGGNLQVDLNYMFRTPLWPVEWQDSKMIGSYQARRIPLLDIHELAAGKLAALFARETIRDLFDAHQLLTRKELDRKRLRLAFIVYGAMNRRDWRKVCMDDVRFSTTGLESQLIPMFRAGFLETIENPRQWIALLVNECRRALSALLPFKEAELEFLNLLLDRGDIKPALLTMDEELAEKIAHHPGLKWKALNVLHYRDRMREL